MKIQAPRSCWFGNPGRLNLSTVAFATLTSRPFIIPLTACRLTPPPPLLFSRHARGCSSTAEGCRGCGGQRDEQWQHCVDCCCSPRQHSCGRASHGQHGLAARPSRCVRADGTAQCNCRRKPGRGSAVAWEGCICVVQRQSWVCLLCHKVLFIKNQILSFSFLFLPFPGKESFFCKVLPENSVVPSCLAQQFLGTTRSKLQTCLCAVYMH